MITLADGSVAEVKSLTLGGNGISAFAGLNGPASSAQAIGFELTGVDFALAVFTPDEAQTDLAGINWLTLSASATGFNLLGIPGLTVSGGPLRIALNQVFGLADGVDANNWVVDYSSESMTVLTGPSSTEIFDFDGADGELLEVGGALTVTVGDFFHVSGEFAFRKSLATVKLADGSALNADLLTIGGYDLTAFAGVNGPADSGNAIGLSLTGVEFALAMFSEHLAAGDTTTVPGRWLSLRATAGTASFVGVSGITISTKDVVIEVNRQLGLADGDTPNVVDFKDSPFAVTTGVEKTMELDFDGADGELLRARGRLTISLYGFVEMKGNLAFSRSTDTVTLNDGSQVEVNQLTLGASDLDVFAGVAVNGKPSLGFNLGGVDLALVIQSSKH